MIKSRQITFEIRVIEKKEDREEVIYKYKEPEWSFNRGRLHVLMGFVIDKIKTMFDHQTL